MNGLKLDLQLLLVLIFCVIRVYQQFGIYIILSYHVLKLSIGDYM